MARHELSEADAFAERARLALIRRISHTYAQAYNDIERKLKAHLARFEARDREMRAKLEAGEIEQSTYDNWKRGQVFAGERWRQMRDQITRDLYRVNTRAVTIINRERSSVFADNANYEMYELDQHGRMGIGWTLYNRQAVDRLLRDEPDLLPRKEISKLKDGVYNRQLIARAVSQGIVQGESIPDIARRIAQATGSQNLHQMVSFARTAMTGAQNAGRMEALHQAQERGIKVRKRWMATLDHRTRDAHQELDMQVAEVDEPFRVGMAEIMFPGDPNAPAELVANCRCTLVYDHPEYPMTLQRRDNETGEVIGETNYKEWLKAHAEQAQETPELLKKVRESG